MNSIRELVAVAGELMGAGLRLEARAQRHLALLAQSGEQETAVLASALLELGTAKERLDGELCAAQEIQRSLLPKLLPRCPDHSEFELSALLEPARGVGGDLYDWSWLDAHRFFFMIGDVSDKGISAALIMAVTRTLVKSHMLPDVALHEVLARVNDDLAQCNELMMFVTALFGVLDVRTGELEWCDGGHNLPCLLPCADSARMLEKETGLALGLSPHFQYRSQRLTLQAGDRLFLYTDGVTEAMNPLRELYTEARLQAALNAMPGASAHELVQGVMQDVKRFAAGAQQSDDITMLALRYRGSTNDLTLN